MHLGLSDIKRESFFSDIFVFYGREDLEEVLGCEVDRLELTGPGPILTPPVETPLPYHQIGNIECSHIDLR